MVNKSNIEEKLFDYFEGSLSAAEKLEVDTFVQENPTYQADFQAWSKAQLPEEAFTYEHADELLVPVGSGKPMLFGRWKNALLLLAVSMGLSAGLYYQMDSEQSDQRLATNQKTNQNSNENSNQNISQKDTRSETGENGQSTGQSIDVINNAVNTEKETKAETGDFSSSQANPSQVNSHNTTKQGATKGRKKSKASGVVDEFGDTKNNGVKTGIVGKVNNSTSTDTYSASSNRSTGNSANENFKEVTTTTTTGSSTGQAVGDNSILAASAKRQNVEPVANRKVNSSSSNINAVEVLAETTQLERYFSAPDLKKGRSKFEAYEKNEVKFINDKNPYLILPNALPIGVNSSFAGNAKGIRLSYVSSRPWSELTENYVTNKLSIDTYVKALRGGVAVMVESDVLGHNKFLSQGVSLTYSPKIRVLGTATVEPSVTYGYYKKAISWNQIKTNLLLDSRTGAVAAAVDQIPTDLSKSVSTYSNLGGGLLLNTNKFYLGVAFDNLLTPTYNLEGHSGEIEMPVKISAQAGGSLVPLKKHQYFVLSPAVYYMKFGAWDNLWLSNTIAFHSVFIGASYSSSNDLLLSLGINNKHLRVNYTYGKMTSVTVAQSMNTHQLGLTFNILKD